MAHRYADGRCMRNTQKLKQKINLGDYSNKPVPRPEDE
jgi:hypothetical protein